MSILQSIAKHFRDVYFGGNWTDVNIRDTLADVNLEEATAKLYNLNTIAVLTYHINYYVNPVMKVLQGDPLKASDKESFELPPLKSSEEWEKLKARVLNDAEIFAAEIEKFDELKLFDDFSNSKYGSFFRNLLGVIEHTHYHLGQIVLIKKMLREKLQ